MRSECIFDNAPQGAQDSKLEGLKKLYPACFDQEGKLVLERLEAVLKKEGSFSSESYNLQWLGKAYARMLAEERPLSVLEIESNPPSQNLLIRGDNLEALKHLQHAYYEKIKCIYIDPPYNTGNDAFIYQDKRNFTPQDLGAKAGMSEGEARRVLEFIAQGANTHSAWLTFMYPRLVLARHLLRDDGAIFISIDDNEQAPLKLLCDEVFGEGNFCGDFVRKTKSTTNDAKIGVNYQHEFLLCYAKDKSQVKLLGGQKDLSRYTNPDNDPNGAWAPDNPSAKSGNPKTGYFGVKNPHTGKVDYPPEGRFWLFSKDTLETHIKSGRICFKKEHAPDERGFIYKRYLSDLKSTQKTFDSLAFTDNAYMNQAATKELLDLGLAEAFSYPKSVSFIQKILLHATTGGGGEPRDCPRLFCRLRDDRACRDGAKPRRWGQAAIYFNPTRRGNWS